MTTEKRILLPEENENLHYYRANLHCHSTISDGNKTPEQLKADYQAHGYSVVAFTDHEAFIPHNDLTDDSFVALNGYELAVGEKAPEGAPFSRTAHMCFVALDPDTELDVCHHRTRHIKEKNRPLVKFDESLPDYERVYGGEGVSDMMRKGREGGFFVTYNHPTWSLESYPQYMSYDNMNAMEIVNFGCVIVGYDDDNGHCYDDMLRGGKRIFCVATDDNHNRYPDTTPDCDSYGGYTMIAAEKLDYRSITASLTEGRFYCAAGNYRHVGPKILSLVYEGGKVTVKTSPVKRICYMTGRRHCANKEAHCGEYVSEATFDVAEGDVWFRLTAADEGGYKAYTNAYFVDQL